ncbi:MAG: tetratricopeptide repeat protein [Deltaproteobacteria bacterium]|nr:tetratricopeptide repeat protein [Deltaproteobacteria bacterium]
MPLSAVTVRRFQVGLAIALMGALLLSPLSARAEGEDPAVIEKITHLNKKALDAFNSLEFEDARKLLKQALDLCSSAGLDKHPIKARTHIHMGVVLITTKQEELGIKQFKKALEVQPGIQVTKALANPEIMQAFEEAASSAGGTGDSGDSGSGDANPGGAGAGGGGSSSAEVKGDITLVPVTRGKKGKPVAISVTVSPALTGYTKMVLAYRAEGEPDFVGVDMRRSGSKFVGEIPVEATNGSVVHYYVEAETDEEDAVATNGTEEKPYAVALSVGKGGGDDDNASDSDDTDDDFPRFFLGLSGGVGTGYTTGNGELHVANKVTPGGFAPASAFHIAPEVGYFLTPQFRLSLQGRIQYVTGRTPLNLAAAMANGFYPGANPDSCGTDRLCTTGSPLAPALFARGTWFFGSSTVRPYVSLALGGGIIRHVVQFNNPQTPPVCGKNGNLVCVDSVLAGPIFAGPGGGIHVALTPIFGLVAEVNSVIGFPKVTFHLDFNAGVATQF